MKGEGQTQSQRKGLIRLGLAAAAVLLLAGVLTLVAGEAVRERLIRPLLVFFQVVRIYFAALPQLAVWFFVLLLLLALGGYLLRDLSRAPRVRRERPRPMPAERLPRLDTVRALAERLRLAREGEYFRWRVRRELLDFLVKLLAWRRKIPPEEALALIRSGEWTSDPDPKIREFFTHGLTRRGWRWRFSWLRQADTRFFQELGAVLDYLERYAQGGERGTERS